MPRDRVLAYGAFAIVCTVWGTTYLAIRVAIETLPTFLLAGVRFSIAGAILLTLCALAGQKIPTRIADWWNLTIVGLLLIGVANVAVVWAEHYITSGFTALLVATAPFWMATIESMRRNGERMTRRKLGGMIVGFAGVALLVAPDLRPSSFNAKFLLGVLALQIGAICWNLGSVRSKYHPVAASALVAAAIQMLTGGLVVAAIGLMLGEADEFRFSTRSLIAFLYLLVFGSIVAYGAYVYALSKLPTSTVSLYAYVNPTVAVVLGWAILGEPLGWRSFASMAIILSGVALVQSRRAPLDAGARAAAEVEIPVATELAAAEQRSA
ncbi:MAG TPA: EamA family transporter [Thermoanaerobaculia bacterium]|nr:EamA family transporter [Thermoanaerobaculia bacterium]